MVDKFDALNLGDQYTLAIDALQRLGIERNYDSNHGYEVLPPTFEDIIASIDRHTKEWMEKSSELMSPDRLFITPAIGKLSLTQLLAKGGVRLEGNSRWENSAQGRRMWQALRDSYHNNGTHAPAWHAGILLQDIMAPTEQAELINEHGEPGLRLTDESAGQQLRHLGQLQRVMRKNGLRVQPITASDYVVIRFGGIADLDVVKGVMPDKDQSAPAVRREHGTITRFVQYHSLALAKLLYSYDSSNLVGDESREPVRSVARRSDVGVRCAIAIDLRDSPFA
jgi:hypothetical protein